MAKKRSKSPKYVAAKKARDVAKGKRDAIKVKRTAAKGKKDAAQALITSLKGKANLTTKEQDRLTKAIARRKKIGTRMKTKIKPRMEKQAGIMREQAAIMKDPDAKIVKKKVVKKKVTKKKVVADRRVVDDRRVDDQYGGRVGEYQVPNRSFNWQTDPTEQALMASAMGRPDLAQMMLTGQYGPLAGQQYQYGGGQTRINYGPGGTGSVRGVGDTSGLLGPLGTTAAETATGDTRPFHERYMAGETAFGGHEGILKRLADAEAAKNVVIPGGTGTGRGGDPRLYDPRYQQSITSSAVADQARQDAFNVPSYSPQSSLALGSAQDFPSFTPALTPRAIGAVHDFRTPTISPGTMASPSARLAMDAAAANPYDFGAGRTMTGGAAPFLPFRPQTPVQMEMGTGIAPAPWLVPTPGSVLGPR